MKRMIFLVAVIAVLGLLTPLRAETVHNLLKQNDRTNALYDLSVIPDLLKSNANVFFVDNEATYASDASDGLHGETPQYPFASFNYAVGKCTAGQNNIIVCMPYSVEDFDSAGDADVDVSGIHVLGLGYGPARPKFLYTNANGTFVVGRTGDGATFQNITFQASVTGVTVGVQIEDGADNITFIDCEWLDGELSGTDEFVTAVDVVTEVNDLSFIGCKWTSVGAGATAAIDIGDGAAKGLNLIDCVFFGDWATACVFSDTALTEVLIDNTVFIDTNTDEFGIEFQGTSNRGTVRNSTFVTSGNYVDMGGLQDGGGNKTAQYAADSDTISYGSFALGDDGITAAKIAANAITSSEIADNAIDEGALAANSITASEIADDAIDAGAIADASIDAATFAAGAIDASAIAANAITSSEFADGTLTAAKFGTDAITATIIAADAITTTELATGCISSDEIADNAIDAGALAANCITTSELATGCISADEVADDSIDAGAIANDAIDATAIADAAIDAATFAAGAIDASAIAANAITSSEIADNSIDAGALAADCITNAEIANDAIGATEIADAAIDAATFAAGAIDASAIATDAIGAAEIATDAITSAEIAANAIGASEIADAALDWASFASDFKNGIEDDIVAAMDANSILADLGGISEIGDKVQADMDANSVLYWQPRVATTAADEVTQDLFAVAGGPIQILQFYGVVDVLIGANATTCQIIADATAGAAFDHQLSTAVNIETDAAGTIYVFTAANPSVLTPLTGGGAAGATNFEVGWHAPIGMIEQAMSADPGGAVGDHITWYMVWRPLAAGVTVTAQ